MGDHAERPLIEYLMPTTYGYRSAIRKPAIKENQSFEI